MKADFEGRCKTCPRTKSIFVTIFVNADCAHAVQGVEMEADFEGTMQDVPKDQKQDNEESEDQEGDADRIDQQMGDVGDNEEVRV